MFANSNVNLSIFLEFNSFSVVSLIMLQICLFQTLKMSKIFKNWILYQVTDQICNTCILNKKNWLRLSHNTFVYFFFKTFGLSVFSFPRILATARPVGICQFLYTGYILFSLVFIQIHGHNRIIIRTILPD